MTAWPRVFLGEVATLDRSSVDPAKVASETRYLGLENIARGGALTGHETVSSANPSSLKFRFSSEHVLYGKLRPNLGKIAIPDFNGVCSTDIVPIRPSAKLDRTFLAHYLRQPSMVEYATRHAAGANLPRLSPNQLAAFPVPLPDIHEQRRIAAILDLADAVRAKCREVLAHLDTLPQSIFHNTFGSLEWRSSLGDIATVRTGPFGSLLHREDYVDFGIPILNPMHILGGDLRPDSRFSVPEDKAAELEMYRVHEGDVVMARRGEMGRAGVVGSEHEGLLCGTGSMILRPKSGASGFLHAVITSPRMKAHLSKVAIGTTLSNLNESIVASAPAPSIPDNAAADFSRQLVTSAERRHLASKATAEADTLFHSLQSRAFRGEL